MTVEEGIDPGAARLLDSTHGGRILENAEQFELRDVRFIVVVDGSPVFVLQTLPEDGFASPEEIVDVLGRDFNRNRPGFSEFVQLAELDLELLDLNLGVAVSRIRTAECANVR